MYSMVLMMALSNSAAIPAQHDVVVQGKEARYGNHLQSEHKRWGCHGCWGGGCYGGCWGGYSYGCCGCWGGYSYSGWGCYGCYGCSGCWGGYSSGCYGCWGGYYSGCYGCYGCYGGYASYYSSAPYATVYAAAPTYSNSYADGTAYSYSSTYATTASAPRAATTRATIVVKLPADARLTFDNHATTTPSATRTFVSPPLPSGKAYRYTLKAQVTRNGKPVALTKEITVRAGKRTDVAFDFSGTMVTKK